MSLKALCRAALAVAAIFALGAVAAHAQVAYTANTIQSLAYKEFKKDGRFYVFNDLKKADAFEQTGETGVGITRPGIGPNGETVVADSETALELFLFKHGLSAEVTRPAAPPLNIVWRDGKTRFTVGSGFYLEMSNRIQLRYFHNFPDGSVKLAGTENAGDSKGNFQVRRAKFKLEGFMFRPDLEFELQLNWPDVTGTPASRFLEDANLDWDVSRGKKTFRVRFGQFKAPYGRQQLTSSGSQQFVDRAITDGRYNPGRETGLALWGTLGTTKFEWRTMVSNGNGRSQAANDNSAFLYTARAQYQLLGATRMNQWTSGALLTEGDLGDSATGPLLAVAANFLKNDLRTYPTPAVAQNDNTQWGADAIFKSRGFAAQVEYHDRKSKPYIPATAPATGIEAGPDFKDKGFLVQASYAFKTPSLGPGPGYIEIAGRYARIDPSDARGGDKQTEIGGAVSWYYSKHPFKLQADYRQLENEAANSGNGTKDDEFRLQMQFIF